MLMRGTISAAHAKRLTPKVQYITVRAPNRSESQPPKARMRPEGKLKQAASRPAMARLMP